MHSVSLIKRTIWGFTLLFFIACGSEPQAPILKPTAAKSEQYGKDITTAKCMVVTAHPYATEVGVAILKAGGNAWDAATAVHFALAVVYPQAGNLGGGGFMVSRTAAGTTATLDFREMAPAAAHPKLYLDSLGEAHPTASQLGAMASGVPGSVDGILSMHEKYGNLPLSQLLQPAINLAQNGFVLTALDAVEINEEQALFKQYNPQNTYLQKSTEWQAGDTLKQLDLAQTLTRIAQNGKSGFYEGQTAELIASTMQAQGGIIDIADLRNYRSVWRTPLTHSFYNYQVIGMPPPSSGGVALFQMLYYLQKLRIDTLTEFDTHWIHRIAAVEKLAYADRSKYLGDPDFYPVPVNKLLDTNYLNSRLANISIEKVIPSEAILPGIIVPTESEQTTHFSIVDEAGNAVAITTTLNSAFGSRMFINGAGFLMNNEMDDFAIKPGLPNQFGLLGDTANQIIAGKRMLSSMTPIIVEKEGALHLVIGTPGGATIITSVLQTLLNVTMHKLSMYQAVQRPRFHHQWMPDLLYIEEDRFPQALMPELTAMGYILKPRPPIGRVDAIMRDLQTGSYSAGADPRGDDWAGGY